MPRVSREQASEFLANMLRQIEDLTTSYMDALDEIERLRVREALGRDVFSGKTVFVLWDWNGAFGVYTSLDQAQSAAPDVPLGHPSRKKLMTWKLNEVLSEDYLKKGDTLAIRVWQLGDSEWSIYECYVNERTT